MILHFVQKSQFVYFPLGVTIGSSFNGSLFAQDYGSLVSGEASLENMLARSNRIQTGRSLAQAPIFRNFYFSDTQPGKSETKKVDEIPLLWILGFFDHFVQDFPGK
uniref:Uncharacterized protein n=1 Tax=Candidatus Kentrum sp. UNK TaxID=2126344 RepID=A0A451AS97_9GAMM|nr:MAG: hypothetical protein BECKUNK1418G_GA0071005_12851 [Candidatus Kentron sp. UNK]VFK73749.1 MAG: hypothetical protein BECKUNK1418H_GA0071006_12741 [Candidatus Kentron sp. UNK]